VSGGFTPRLNEDSVRYIPVFDATKRKLDYKNVCLPSESSSPILDDGLQAGDICQFGCYISVSKPAGATSGVLALMPVWGALFVRGDGIPRFSFRQEMESEETVDDEEL